MFLNSISDTIVASDFSLPIYGVANSSSVIAIHHGCTSSNGSRLEEKSVETIDIALISSQNCDPRSIALFRYNRVAISRLFPPFGMSLLPNRAALWRVNDSSSTIARLRSDENPRSFSTTNLDEKTYIDPDTGTAYVLPNHVILMRAASKCFSAGEYKGFGMSLKKKFKGALCDMIYLEKKQDQIDSELQQRPVSGESKKTFTFYIRLFITCCMSAIVCLLRRINPALDLSFFEDQPSQDVSKIYKRSQKQLKLAQEFSGFLDKYHAEWKYKSFAFCGYGELLQLGMNEKDAREIHVLLAYYQRK